MWAFVCVFCAENDREKWIIKLSAFVCKSNFYLQHLFIEIRTSVNNARRHILQAIIKISNKSEASDSYKIAHETDTFYQRAECSTCTNVETHVEHSNKTNDFFFVWWIELQTETTHND